jgi:hypothetical protein
VWLQWNAATGSIRPVRSNLVIQSESVSMAKSNCLRRHGDSGRSSRQ